MAYNESLAERVQEVLHSRKIKFTEKKMFGGVCFLVDDKMLMGVEKERLMVRIDPEDEPKALRKKGAKPMDFTGRIMKGFLFVDDTAVDMDKDLEYWIDLCMKYNPKAKAGKKKAKAEAKDKVKPKVKAMDKVKAKEKPKVKAETKSVIKSRSPASPRKKT